MNDQRHRLFPWSITRSAEGGVLNMIALWDLLLGVCVAACLGGALAATRIAQVGLLGHALAIAVGLTLGVCCAWTMQVVGNLTSARIKRHSASLQERYFRTLYVAAMLWTLLSSFLGMWTSLLALRLALGEG